MRIPFTAVKIIAFAIIHALYGIAAILPVDQVVGFKDRHARKNEHCSCNHIIDRIYPDYIGIRKIGINKRIGICTVSIITLHFLSIAIKPIKKTSSNIKNAFIIL